MIVNRPPPRSATDTSSAPVAKVPSGPATDTMPVTTRRWRPSSTLVTVLVKPMQT